MSMNKYYEPKYLRGVIRKIEPLRLFFRQRFFSEGITFPTETVSFEFAANKRLLLPYSTVHGGAVPVDREGYQLKTFTPALLSGSRTITPDTLAMKMLGESPYNSGMSPDERAARIAANDLMELQDALFRKEEYMCARIKQDGKLSIEGQGVSAVVEYGFDQIETVKASDKWTANYDVLGKLAKTARELRKHGVNPDMLIVGADVGEAISLNEGVQKLRHDFFVDIPKPDSLEDGITFLMQIRAPGIYLNVYEYNEYYTDEAGNLVPLIDPGTAILMSSRERNMMLYGAVTYIDSRTRDYVSEMAEYVPYVVTEEDPPSRKLIVSSRCLPMPRDVKSWYVLKNLV